MSRSHSFSVELASEFGIPTAILLQNFCHWYLKNQSDNHQFFDGDYWVRMKISQLHIYYPYFSKDQLRRYVEKMVQIGLLDMGKFNQKKSDRTNWYKPSLKGKKLMGIATGEFASQPIGEFANPSGEFAKCIYKEENIERKYIYTGAYDFLKKNCPIEVESIEMQNKRKIKNWDLMIVNFDSKVVEEELKYSPKILLARLRRLCMNWKDFSSTTVKQETTVKLNRIGS